MINPRELNLHEFGFHAERETAADEVVLSLVSQTDDKVRMEVARFPNDSESTAYIDMVQTLATQVCRAINVGLPVSIFQSMVTALLNLPPVLLPEDSLLLVAGSENADALFRLGDDFMHVFAGDRTEVRSEEEMLRCVHAHLVDEAEADDDFDLTHLLGPPNEDL